jgi:general secretion pathway protein M
MNSLPEGNAGKALALGIAAVLLCLIYFMIVTPLLNLYADGQQALVERGALAAILERSVHDLPRLRGVAAQWKQKAPANDLLLPASSDAIAAATLQTTVKDLVAQAGTSLTSTEILSPQAQDQFRRVGIHVAFSTNQRLLTAVLRGIEVARPLLFVDNLDLRDAGQSDGSDPGLAVAFDVYGFPAP